MEDVNRLLANNRRFYERPEPVTCFNAYVVDTKRGAVTYARQSSPFQVRNNQYSQKAQDGEQQAIDDGYSPEYTKDEAQALRNAPDYPGHYRNGQIWVEQRDLGISATKEKESKERPGLSNVIWLIEQNLISTLYVMHVSRLCRDQFLIDATALTKLLEEKNVILATPSRRFNMALRSDLLAFQYEAQWSATEASVLKDRMYQPKLHKAHEGRWVGGKLPAGYIIDERKEIAGRLNPDWHKYVIWEPHAQVVRLIFEKMLVPNMTPGRIARYIYDNGIRFEPFPPYMMERYRYLSFSDSTQQSDGSWMVTPGIVASMITNPVYIGYWLYGGELICKNNHVPIIDEEVFWVVQKNLADRKRK